MSMTIDKAMEFLESYHVDWSSVRHEQMVRKELERYSPERLGDLCEEIVSSVNQRFAPDVSDIRSGASTLGLSRMGRKSERPPTDPDDLEEFYYGRGGVLDQSAHRIIDRDDQGNDTTARLKREQADGVTAWGARELEYPPLSKEAEVFVERLRERWADIVERHPEPEKRDFRLAAAGIVRQLVKPLDVAQDMWDIMSDANKRVEIAMQAAQESNQDDQV